MKIKLFLVLALCCLLTLIACLKESTPGYNACTGTKPDADSAALLKFAADHQITPTRDSTGLYYEILDSGAGPSPVPTAIVYFTFIGTQMNGTLVDSTSDASKTGFPLNQLIQGFQIGLPKIMRGGHIKLLIPSSYAYGCAGSQDGRIPPNAPLYFDIKLVDVVF